MNMHAHTFARVTRVSRTDEAALAEIDAFVCAHPDGQIFQRPQWLHAVAAGCGQGGFYLVAHDASGRLTGIVPVTEMRSPLFGRALVSSGFGVGGGILADGPTAEVLAGELWGAAKAGNFNSVELRGGAMPGLDWDVQEGAHANFARDLAGDDDTELLAIPRKQRAEVRKAVGFALEVQVGRTRQDRDAHYAIYAASVRNLGTPVFPRRLFDAVLDRFDDADIMTIRKDGVALASVLSLRHRGTIMPYWGGGTADARTWRANDALYWELMRHARATGCRRFDFGRSKVGSGAFAFKKNWGFVPEPMRYWTRGVARAVSPNDAKYRRKIELWKKLPLPVANLLGPIISRGLG